MPDSPDRLDTLLRTALQHGAAHPAHDTGARERVVAGVRHRRAQRVGVLGACAAVVVALGIGLTQLAGPGGSNRPPASASGAGSPAPRASLGPATGGTASTALNPSPSSGPLHGTTASGGSSGTPATSNGTKGSVEQLAPGRHAVVLAVGDVVAVTLRAPSTTRVRWSRPFVEASSPSGGGQGQTVRVRAVEPFPSGSGRGERFEIVAIRAGTARVSVQSVPAPAAGSVAPDVTVPPWVLTVTVRGR